MIFPENLQLLKNHLFNPVLLKVIVVCEMVEYEYLILDIIVAWRIYLKILATILSVLYA